MLNRLKRVLVKSFIGAIALGYLFAKDFKGRVQEFYGTDAYYTDLIYIKVLCWVGNDRLLAGLDARTFLPTASGQNTQEPRTREWISGYLIDVPSKKVLDRLSEDQLLSRYRIKVVH